MKSNNKVPFIIAAVVGVALAIGGGVWYVNSRSQDEQNANQTTNTSMPETTSQESAQAKTIAGFLAADKTQKCTFSYKEGTTDISGTMYFATGRKMSGDFKTVTEGTATNGNMIITKDTQYFWTPDTNKGVKVTLTTAEANNETATPDASPTGQGLDLDKNYDFNCSEWSIDESKFVVPSNVEFMDLSQVQSQLNNLPQ